MVEDETAQFAEYFARSAGGTSHRTAQEVVVPLHDESLHQLSELARVHGVSGTNEHMRSIALQLCLDQFRSRHRDGPDALVNELHLSAGDVKERALCLFTDTLDDLGRLERDLHCSETILIETAIREAAAA